MTAYTLDDFLERYWYRCGTPDLYMSNQVSSKNCDPSAHYSMEQVEQMLNGDDFAGIILNGVPIDGKGYWFNKKGNLLVTIPHPSKSYVIECD